MGIWPRNDLAFGQPGGILISRRRKIALAIVIALGASSSACTIARIVVKLSVPPPIAVVRVPAYDVLKQANTGVARIGVGKADLTPVPGFPTGGHGPAGSLSYGYWTRLHARAFTFQDTDGETLVLVSCDLFAIPAGLHAVVARHVSTTWASRGVRVAPDGVILAATHTHQGPGNYMTSETYNQFGSNYPGFDRDLFNFLAKQISAAVDDALNDAQEHDDPVHVTVRTGALPATLLRNRSPRTFLYNQHARVMMQKLHAAAITNCEAARLQGEEGLPDWNLDGCPRLRAVDRNLTVLELQRGSRRIGLLLFFATHPTVLPHHAAVYSADFSGIAAGILERTGPDRAVVGFFNGAEGDITTRRTMRNLTDTFNLANQLVAATKAVLGGPGREVPVALSIRHRALTPQARPESCTDPLTGYTSKLGASPVMGAAALGGAEGDRTLLYDLGWREGVIDRHRSGQGPKLPALDSQLLRLVTLTEAFAPPKSFPQTLPITYAKIGGFHIAAVPGELSTAQGAMIRERLNEAHGELELIGLANEYTGYVASQDEYHAQDYMAASTIWGPQEGDVITCTLVHLKEDSPQATGDGHVPARSFRAGPKATTAFGLSFVGEACTRPDAELSGILTDQEGTPIHGLPWFAWEEPVAPATGPALELNDNWKRRVTIHNRTNPAAAYDDDQGPGILTLLLTTFCDTPKGCQRRWTATWATPLWKHPGAGYYSFRVTRPDGTVTCSEYFQVPQPLSETTDSVKAAPHCPPS